MSAYCAFKSSSGTVIAALVGIALMVVASPLRPAR
jgi:hypothetical protein